MPESFVFTRLYLPRPVEQAAVAQFLTRLSASDVPRPVAFELHAGDDGVQYLMGCAPSSVHVFKRLLRAALPTVTFGAGRRPALDAAGRVDTQSSALPLRDHVPEDVVAAVLAAVAGRHDGDHVVLQVVLGRVRGPRPVGTAVADPLQPLGDRLWSGSRRAPAETRRRLVDHAAVSQLAVTVRIGVSGPDAARRTRLARSVFGSLQALESVGVHLRLRRAPVAQLDYAQPARTGLSLTAAECVTLLGWPLGERNYAGIEPIHPQRLAVPKVISKEHSVFAIGTAPGPERPIGFPPRDRLQHLVVLGPTGSGKSQALEHLILSDIAAGRACVVIEPKRQLVDSLLDHLPASAAGKVVVLDAADEPPVGFNPLDVGDRDPDVAMDGVLAALQAVFEDGWGPRTEYLIQGSLLSLARAGVARGEPYTLVDLPTLLTDAHFRRSVTKYITDDPALAIFWNEFEELQPGQRAAMIAAPLNKLRKLVLRKNLAAVLGQSQPRFRLRDVFREGKTVLVPLNESLIGSGASRLLGSLMVAELWLATLERATEKDPMSHPGMVFVDEVQNYLHLPTSIGDALATSRSYGVAWHLAHQFREQLPRAMRTALDVNARSKISFALSNEDARDLAKQSRDLTAEDFASLGKYEIYAQLMVDGAPGGWFSARTLPPPKSVGAAELIRQASRDTFGAQEAAEQDRAETPGQLPTQAPRRNRGQRARRS